VLIARNAADVKCRDSSSRLADHWPPPARGRPHLRPTRDSLADCEPGRSYCVSRVVYQEPAFLQFVERCGLMPGTSVTVEARDPQADAIRVRPRGKEPLSLGTSAAAKILVESG